jgi:hypothetical protein
LVELLRGSISKGVMEIVTRKGQGLFPAPREIRLSCSCPDWATMCKHVAATLYGVGARLDREPELLFTLRGVDPAEMVEAAVDRPPSGGKPRKGRLLPTDELSSVFGVDLDMGIAPAQAAPARIGRRGATRTKKTPTTRSAKKRTDAAPPSIKRGSTVKPATTKNPAKRGGTKKTPVAKRKPATRLR